MQSDASQKILIVDDERNNREVLQFHVERLGHTPIQAENGLSALAQVQNMKPDLVLLDINMPELDGYGVLKMLRDNADTSELPVIMLTAVDDPDVAKNCISLGADDYVLKPFKSEVLKARIENSLKRKKANEERETYSRLIQDYNLRLEERVDAQVQEIVAGHKSTIFALSKLAESRDPETGEHLERMREYCKSLALEVMRDSEYAFLVDEQFIETLYSASPLHDIGKVGVPDNVLKKPGKLTPDEFREMQAHTTLGAEALGAVCEEFPNNGFLTMGIEIALSHHEKWDGSGYPNGLTGQNIPLAARILAVGDVYDALTSKRCYKEAFSHDKAREIIEDGRDKHFDPVLVDAFIRIQDEFIRINKTLKDI